DDEFDELDDFLLSDRCADDAMTMDTLHGYLTALAIGPLEMPMAAWLPRVWGGDSGGDSGGDPAAAPRFASEKEQKRIVGLIARFMNEIAITFEAAPKEFEPLFCEEQTESGEKFLDAEGWAAGFWEGMQLCADAWEPVWSSDLAPLMQPFYLLGADEIEEEELAEIGDPARRHKLATEIESAVPLLFRFWQPRRRSATPTVQRETPKTGRNDPCPCGSGKKFKKCCGEPPHQG
ncbi:MAG: UPF0149 family protein, partial [Burkholderiaceae bacterium]